MATNNSDLFLDPETGDLKLVNNDLFLIKNNIDSVRQRLALRFSIWKDEWKFNLDFGFPYWSYLGRKTSKQIIDVKVRQTATSPSDVLRIENFTSTFENRYYQAYFTVITTELEEVNVSFIGLDEYTYPSPEDTTQDLCPSLGEVEYGEKLYYLINFRLPSFGDVSWINNWD